MSNLTETLDDAARILHRGPARQGLDQRGPPRDWPQPQKVQQPQRPYCGGFHKGHFGVQVCSSWFSRLQALSRLTSNFHHPWAKGLTSLE